MALGILGCNGGVYCWDSDMTLSPTEITAEVARLRKLDAERTQGKWVMVENSWAITTIYKPDQQGTLCELTISEDISEDDFDEAQIEQKANAEYLYAAPDM